jgi:hypothetical protein
VGVNTLLLDRSLWDLCKDAFGNIAMARDPYAIAQDVASAIKLFRGELWYDTPKGIPYWGTILGHAPPVTYMKAQFVKAALTVPEVVKAVCFISSVRGREVQGQVQVTTSAGVVLSVGF